MDLDAIRRFLNEWGGIVAVVALLLATPLNVAANAITPKYLNWQASRSGKSAHRRIKVLRGELVMAQWYHDSPSEFNTMLLTRLMFMVFGMGMVIFLSVYEVGSKDMDSWSWSSFVEIIVNLFVLIMVLWEYLRTVRQYGRVLNFDGYKSRTEAMISRLSKIADDLSSQSK